MSSLPILAVSTVVTDWIMEQCQAITQDLRLLNHELEMPPQEFAKTEMKCL